MQENLRQCDDKVMLISFPNNGIRIVFRGKNCPSQVVVFLSTIDKSVVWGAQCFGFMESCDGHPAFESRTTGTQNRQFIMS